MTLNTEKTAEKSEACVTSSHCNGITQIDSSQGLRVLRACVSGEKGWRDLTRVQSNRDQAERKKNTSETRELRAKSRRSFKKTKQNRKLSWFPFESFSLSSRRGEKRRFWERFQHHSLFEIIKSSKFSQVSSQRESLLSCLNKSQIRNVSESDPRI